MWRDLKAIVTVTTYEPFPPWGSPNRLQHGTSVLTNSKKKRRESVLFPRHWYTYSFRPLIKFQLSLKIPCTGKTPFHLRAQMETRHVERVGTLPSVIIGIPGDHSCLSLSLSLCSFFLQAPSLPVSRVHGSRHPEPLVRRFQVPPSGSAIPIWWGTGGLWIRLLLFWLQIPLLAVLIGVFLGW